MRSGRSVSKRIEFRSDDNNNEGGKHSSFLVFFFGLPMFLQMMLLQVCDFITLFGFFIATAHSSVSASYTFYLSVRH